MKMEISNTKIKSPYDALIRAVQNADKYESVLVVGITKGDRQKDVNMYTEGDVSFQLICSLVNALSVEVAMGRIKL